MKLINELYNFDKFWKIFIRQNRCISKWDGERTDKDVFVRRTLNKWFAGKYFQIKIQVDDRIVTKYVYIVRLYFSYSHSGDDIKIIYLEPHSHKPEKVEFCFYDFKRIQLIENETDFHILSKFYPVK